MLASCSISASIAARGTMTEGHLSCLRAPRSLTSTNEYSAATLNPPSDLDSCRIPALPRALFPCAFEHQHRDGEIGYSHPHGLEDRHIGSARPAGPACNQLPERLDGTPGGIIAAETFDQFARRAAGIRHIVDGNHAGAIEHVLIEFSTGRQDRAHGI